MGSFNASLKTTGDRNGLPATVELHEGRLAIKAGETEIGDWALEEVGLEPTSTGYKLAAEGDQVQLDITDVERFTEELKRFSENGHEKEHARKRKWTLFSRKEKRAEESEAVTLPRTPADPDPAETPNEIGEPASRIPASLIGTSSPSPKPANSVESESTSGSVSTTPTEETEPPSFFSRLVAMLDSMITVTEKRWGPLLPNWVFNRIVFLAGFVLVVLAFVFRGTTSVVLLVAGVLALMVGGAAYTDDVMASKLLPGRTTPTHLLLVGVGLLGVGIGFGFIA